MKQTLMLSFTPHKVPVRKLALNVFSKDTTTYHKLELPTVAVAESESINLLVVGSIKCFQRVHKNADTAFKKGVSVSRLHARFSDRRLTLFLPIFILGSKKENALCSFFVT